MDIKKEWRTPKDEIPDGLLLVEIETLIGSDINLISIGDDESTLFDVDENPWLNWTWQDVTRYLTLEAVLPPLEIKTT